MLGLLVVVVAVVIIVASVRVRRARGSWEAHFAGLVAESTWLAHELLPTTLSTPDVAVRNATWTAYRPRVEALMSGLNDAAVAAPKDRWEGLDRLRAAVTELGSAMDRFATATAVNEGESSVRYGRRSAGSRRLSARSNAIRIARQAHPTAGPRSSNTTILFHSGGAAATDPIVATRSMKSVPIHPH